MLLEGKNAIITGCGGGIGGEIVRAFAQNGANLWVCARTLDAGQKDRFRALEEQFHTWIKPVLFDLSEEAEVKKGVRQILSEKIPVDILVNNAGVLYNALFQMTSMEKMREIFEVNYFSPFLLTQYVARAMGKNRAGSIVNIASAAAISVNEGQAAYGASKAALICASKAAAMELGPLGVRVNAIAPGITDTNMIRASLSEGDAAKNAERCWLKRMARPAEIASAALFLASDLSSYITGQVLRVDGGM